MANTGDSQVKQLKAAFAFEGNFPIIYAVNPAAPGQLLDKSHVLNSRQGGKKLGAAILVYQDAYQNDAPAPAPAVTDAKLYVAAGPDPTDKWYAVPFVAGAVPA